MGVYVTLGHLINALNRPETPCHRLGRCVSGASPETSLLETVKRSLISETVSKTDLLVPFFTDREDGASQIASRRPLSKLRMSVTAPQKHFSSMLFLYDH